LVSQLYWACLLYSHVIFYLTVIVNPSQLIPKSFPPLDSLLLIQQLYMAGACMKFGHLMTSSSVPLCKSHKKSHASQSRENHFRFCLHDCAPTLSFYPSSRATQNLSAVFSLVKHKLKAPGTGASAVGGWTTRPAAGPASRPGIPRWSILPGGLLFLKPRAFSTDLLLSVCVWCAFHSNFFQYVESQQLL
jgi:hypothetical protein